MKQSVIVFCILVSFVLSGCSFRKKSEENSSRQGWFRNSSTGESLSWREKIEIPIHEKTSDTEKEFIRDIESILDASEKNRKETNE